jgi:hypothetical protein
MTARIETTIETPSDYTVTIYGEYYSGSIGSYYEEPEPPSVDVLDIRVKDYKEAHKLDDSTLASILGYQSASDMYDEFELALMQTFDEPDYVTEFDNE